MTTEIKSGEIFFLFWEVNFDQVNIEPSLEGSTELCRLVQHCWSLQSVCSRVFAGLASVSGKKNC